MEIKNLKVGMKIKNYKELCTVLNEPVKTSDSKKSQLNDFERYFKYHKEGIKFIIDEIYNKPKDKIAIGNNNIEYIKIIEILILDELAQSKNNGKMFLSKNQTLKELNMINSNYGFCNRRQNKLSVYTNIQNDTIEDFYASANSTLKRNVEKALDNLRKQSLIIWSTEMKIHIVNFLDGCTNDKVFSNLEKEIVYDKYNEEHIKYNTNPHESEREATEEEKKYILRVERETLLSLGYTDKQDLVRNGKWDLFKEQVNDILLKERNIAYYYDCYKILFNNDQIIEGYVYFLKFLLKDTERNNKYNLLNKQVAERLLNNATKRYSKALKEMNSNLIISDKIERRSDNLYIEDNKKLIKLLIDNNSEDIRNKVKKTIL